MSELDLRILKFLSDYKLKLDNLRYNKQEMEKEISHNFFWEDENKSTKLVNFYENNNRFLIFDNNNSNLEEKFNLRTVYDNSDKMVSTTSLKQVFDILNYLIELKP